MTQKVGRNDPCPCGSGKKYKKCCAMSDAVENERERKNHDGAVPRALDWLSTRHRKAFETAIEETLFEGLSDEEYDTLVSLDQRTKEAIHINVTEWVLAEGYIPVNDEYKRVAEILLGPGGPLFTVDQRNWLEQLAERPLRLYEVTDIIPGQQITLCDVLDTRAKPVTVHEKSGSNSTLIGLYVGCRIMAVDDHFELSGAIFPFVPIKSEEVVEELHFIKKQFGRKRKGLKEEISITILEHWLEQFYAPTPIPAIKDSYSGESLLLITDYYTVKDWNALDNALKAQDDVDGNRKAGWNRFIDCEDGQTRSLASINIEQSPDRISVFYKTQDHADKGRSWFEGIAGSTVTFLSRAITDPAGTMQPMEKTPQTYPASAKSDISPEAHTQIFEQTYHRIYANWADEPIPRLNDKTPREAIKTPTGMERVKGLLRMYENREKEQATREGRQPVSFAFLWEELGISP